MRSFDKHLKRRKMIKKAQRLLLIVIVCQAICFLFGLHLLSIDLENVMAWLIVVLNGIMIPVNLINIKNLN